MSGHAGRTWLTAIAVAAILGIYLTGCIVYKVTTVVPDSGAGGGYGGNESASRLIVTNLAPAGEDSLAVQGKWRVQQSQHWNGRWQLDVETPGGGHTSTSVQGQDLEHFTAAREQKAASFTFSRPAGDFVFTPDSLERRDTGTVAFKGNGAFSKEVGELTDQAPTAGQLMNAALAGLEVGTVREVAKGKCRYSIEDILKFKTCGVGADFVVAFGEAGYAFKADDLVKLKNYGVTPQYAAGFRKAGYDVNADTLVKLKNYNVSPEFAAEMAQAGYTLDADQLIKLKNYNVSPAFASAYATAEYRLDVDALIKLKNYNVPANYAADLASAGYRLGVDELIKLKNYNVSAEYAAAFRKAGYTFGVDELIKIKNYNVPADYASALAPAHGKGLTADELVNLHNRGVTVEMIQKIRGQ